MSTDNHSNLIGRILQGARWATILRMTAQLFSWLATLIVVRFISPEDYGLNSMLESPLVIMMLFCTFGMDISLLQAKKLEERELQGVFGWLLLINSVLFLGYFFGAGFIADYFKEPRLELLGQVLAFSFLLVPFRVIPNVLLDRALDFKLRAQLELVATVSAAAVTLGLAYLGYGIWALVIGALVNRVLINLLLMIARPWFITPRFNQLPSGRLLAMGGMLTLAGALSLISDQLTNLIGGPRVGAEMLGMLALGSQFASLPLAKCMPVINQTMIPSFAKFRDQPAQAVYYFEKMLTVAALILIPMLAGMATLADEIVLTLYSSAWELSVVLLVIMATGMLFRFNTVLLKNFALSMGNANISVRVGLAQLSILLPATYFSASYGAVGLALAWSMTEAIVAVIVLIYCTRAFDFRFARLVSCYLPALVGCVSMAGGVRLATVMLDSGHDFGSLIGLVILGVVIYILVIRMFFKDAFYLVIKVVTGRDMSKSAS